jgi:fucose permease
VKRSDTLLVAIAFLAFLAIGLNAGLMGVAWPSMRDTFDVSDAAYGTLSMLTLAGSLAMLVTIGRLIAWAGIGPLLAIGSLLGGLGYLGFLLAPSWPVVVASGVLASIGGAAIIPSLNIYFATYQSAGRITWLNACFGLGATISPMILTAILNAGLSWRWGYGLIVASYALLAIAFGLTARQWPPPVPAKEEKAPATGEEEPLPSPGTHRKHTLALPAVWLSLLLFFTFTGMEATAGQWTYTLFTEGRGISPALAGTWVSVFWASMTVGRVVFGFVVERVNVEAMIRACMAGAVLGAAAIWWGAPGWAWPTLGFSGLALTGFCLSPLFPVLTSQTPDRLGAERAADAIGYQMTAVRLGLAAIPALAGLLVAWVGVESVGPTLFALALGMVVLNEAMARVARA